MFMNTLTDEHNRHRPEGTLKRKKIHVPNQFVVDKETKGD